MRPSIPKKLGKAKDRNAALQVAQFKKSVKAQLKNERLHMIRSSTRTSGMWIGELIDRLEAGQITEEEFTKETGMGYCEAVGAWYRYITAYERTWLRMMVPFQLSKEEYNAIVEGRELP